MKVQKLDTPESFQPVTITITIESEFEAQVLRALARADLRVPDVVIYGEPKDSVKFEPDYDLKTLPQNQKSVAHAMLSRLLTEIYARVP